MIVKNVVKTVLIFSFYVMMLRTKATIAFQAMNYPTKLILNSQNFSYSFSYTSFLSSPFVPLKNRKSMFVSSADLILSPRAPYSDYSWRSKSV